MDIYFYKLAILFDKWNEKTLNKIIKTSQRMSPKELDQFEEWGGVMDVHGNPFKNNLDYEQISSEEKPSHQDNGIFPINTFDGERITEKNFKQWIKREMKDYISAIVENYEWCHDNSDEDDIFNYVGRKGWVDFVNKFNPLKFVKTDSNKPKSIKDLYKEFEKQNGRSLKKDYLNTVKRVVRKKRVSDIGQH